MQALRDYRTLIADIDRCCRRILERHRHRIACTKGCAGNCCRIHLTVYTVEAVSMARALQKLAPDVMGRIHHKSRHTNSFGPCPLLEDGACLMYDDRAVICRTHGLPILTEYRGCRAIGCCGKNFHDLSGLSDADIIDLADLNHKLAAVNRRFVSQAGCRLPPKKRFSIAEAMLTLCPRDI